MILAAGLGTRLGVLSDERPKPLLPVCDLPVIRFNLAVLEAGGVREVIINLHHRGELIEAELGERAGAIAIRYSRESTLLGTGGGIERAADWLSHGGRRRFLVMNGKLVIDLDLGALLAFDAAACVPPAAPPQATLLLREVPDAARWGAIDTRGAEVVRILGKGRGSDDQGVPSTGPLRTGMFTGVHLLDPAIVARLPPGVDSHIIHQAYIPALQAGQRLAATFHQGYFEEHSTPRRYLDGNLALLSGAARLRHPPAPLLGVDPAAEVSPRATVVEPVRIAAGARVEAGAVVGPLAVVGARARVKSGARLRQAVAWPDATVDGVVEQAIVTPRVLVPVPG